MAKKVVIDPQDFDKIVLYIKRQPVRFEDADKAAEIKTILSVVQIMDITIVDPEKKR